MHLLQHLPGPFRRTRQHRQRPGTVLYPVVGDTGHCGDNQAQQHHDNHRAACGIMSQVATCALPEGVLKKALHHGGRVDEIPKACVPGTDKAPDNAQQHQAQHGITGVIVQDFEFLAAEIGNRKGQHQRPVENPHKRIPDPDFILFHDRMLL